MQDYSTVEAGHYRADLFNMTQKSLYTM